MESAIRLFKALPVESKQGKIDENLLKLTASKGFLFAPEVVYHYPDTAHIIDLVNKAYGRSPEQLNQTFHKSWGKVRDASIKQLVIEQIIHYFTTYGFEALGIDSKDSVYIPAEELNVPELQDGIRLVVIKGYTRKELKEKLLQLLSSGIALHQNTITDVLDVASFVGLANEEIDLVNNKEVKAALYESSGTIPGNPTEFLRYIVYRATHTTLLIKNTTLVTAIKEHNNQDIVPCFEQYEKEFGLEQLAEVFYRFKPLFLAFRTNKDLKKSINKIRRLARDHHKPMPEDTLNAVTAHLKQDDQPVLNARFYQALETASVFRKIRLAYALKFRTTDTNSILYRIRNGKSYATSFDFTNQAGAQTAYSAVMQSLINDIAKNVRGKKIYIPAGIRYGLPATEKQFTGDLPSGTCIELTKDMVVGIHWENVSEHRIDLDLSLLSAEAGKLGWDGGYRSSDRQILFSGDMTDAPPPQGASELFYVSREVRGTFIIFVNYYNFNSEVEVPCKILVAQEKPVNPTTHYTVDPNNIVALSNTSMNVRQKNLGIIIADENSCKFYFAESNLGNAITSGSTGYTNQARNYLMNFYTNSITLNDVLADAGARLVDSADEADIDLSPENIDKTSILDLLKENK